MNLKKMERYVRVNQLGQKNLPGRGLTKVQKQRYKIYICVPVWYASLLGNFIFINTPTRRIHKCTNTVYDYATINY